MATILDTQSPPWQKNMERVIICPGGEKGDVHQFVS
jgi:hypothetical protein